MHHNVHHQAHTNSLPHKDVEVTGCSVQWLWWDCALWCSSMWSTRLPYVDEHHCCFCTLSLIYVEQYAISYFSSSLSSWTPDNATADIFWRHHICWHIIGPPLIFGPTAVHNSSLIAWVSIFNMHNTADGDVYWLVYIPFSQIFHRCP